MRNYNQEELLLPTKIIESSVCADDFKVLLSAHDLQIGLGEREVCKIAGKGYVIFDFGKEIKGGVRLLTAKGNRSGVRLRLGESLTECCAEIGEKNATNDGAPRDLTVPLPSLSDVTYFNSGFRFLRIDFLDDAEVKIKNVYAVSKFYDRKPQYVYDGDDESIAKIFAVAKRTIDLCIDKEYVWDGIKRDRLVWIGDLYPEMIAATTLYGRVVQIENSLDFVKEQTPLPGWMNNIQTYSLWWIITLAEYFKRVNCRSFAKKQLAYTNGIVNMIAEHIDEDGELNFEGYFLDWQTGKCADELYGGKALHIKALQSAKELFEAFGQSTEVCDRLLALLCKKAIPECTQKQIIGLKYWATKNISQREKEILLNGGAQGLSTFMSWVVIDTVAKAIGVEKAKGILVSYYSAMIERGATTFWEDFDMQWLENSQALDVVPKDGENGIHGDYGKYCYIGHRHSLCHGWSAGIIDSIKNYF